jgi:hypothetical protein
MTDPLRIDFVRASNGKLALATCATPRGKIVVDGAYATGKGRAEGSDGLIYRMICHLADGGCSGERFEAHDGRIVCLEGVVDKLAVPVRYGGLGKGE